MKRIVTLVLFFAALLLLTFDRVSDLFLLWVPGIEGVKEVVNGMLNDSSSPFFEVFLGLFVVSGGAGLVILRAPFHRACFVTLFSYGLFEIVVIDPFWLIVLYSLLVFLGFLVHYSIEEQSLKTFLQPLVSFFGGGGWRLFPLPLLCSLYALSSMLDTGIPVELRTVHPAPPEEISFKGEVLKLKELVNPYRKYETSDPALFEKYVHEGGVVFFTKCFFCHGALLNGEGHLAYGFNPRPADFTDPGTIAQLEESYVFWRIAKGGAGLPRQSAPWNSAMPAWEEELSKDEIWKVILYIYDATGHRPKSF
ncbi:MAG: c-type cytochrome [Nitrospinota bacterium]